MIAAGEKLEELGFSPYEAKAYCALLVKNPSSGYEVARLSGIPSSKIYETLERLVAKGAVSAVEGDNTLYVPVSVRVLAGQVKHRAELAADALESELEGRLCSNESHFWNIQGESAVVARSRDMIACAEREIILLGWLAEIEWLQAELHSARQRGVSVTVIAYGDGSLPGLNVIRKRGRKGGQVRRERFFMLAVDGRLALTAAIGRSVAGCWSANAAMAFQLREYLYLQTGQNATKKLMKRVLPKLPSNFGFGRRTRK